ncbi:MAG TPA: O-antigen ligase family protein [Solirubrobacterales bacterium]|nr:O-antigen ligase family protein [Solirubrobacterales bacterium]
MPNIPTITAPTWSATTRAAEPLRAGAFALAIAAFELILAKGIVGPEVARYVFLFVGLFALALVFRFPMATALIFLVLTDFIFHSTIFARDVGSLSVRPHELALACLLVVALVRPRRQTWGGVPGTALAAFLGLVATSAALAVWGGETSLSDAFNWARPLGLLTFFYIVVRLFPSPRDRRLLLTAVAVLAAVAGVVAALIAFGADFGSALQAPGDQAIRGQEGLGSLERVRLAGLSAGYAVFWFAVVQIAARQGRSRLLWMLLLAGIALGIAVSFNRNMWLGLAIGALLMAVLGGSMVRNRLAVGAVVAIAGLAVLMAFGSSTTNETVVQPIVKRGSTLLSPGKTSKESSLQDRARETEKAWGAAEDHLLLGVGAGVPFGVYLRQPIASGSIFYGVATIPQLFLHNQYLYLVLIAGIPGLIAFLVFLGVPVLHSIRRVPRDPAIAACGVGILLIMISSVVAIYLTTDDWTPLLALLAGTIVADLEGPAAAGEPAGLSP